MREIIRWSCHWISFGLAEGPCWSHHADHNAISRSSSYSHLSLSLSLTLIDTVLLLQCCVWMRKRPAMPSFFCFFTLVGVWVSLAGSFCFFLLAYRFQGIWSTLVHLAGHERLRIRTVLFLHTSVHRFPNRKNVLNAVSQLSFYERDSTRLGK